MSERFMVDDAGTLIDLVSRDTYDYISDVCPVLNKLVDENEQLKQFFKQLKGSGYWNDDYLTEQDWFDVKQWIERVCKKGDVE